MNDIMQRWPGVSGQPVGSGRIRTCPEDFEVTEVLGFEPSGNGEHVFVWVEKRGANTEFVAKQLAKFAGIPARRVTWSGIKDRHAVTRQYFSVHLPGKTELPWHELQHEEFRVLSSTRNARKLATGAHKGNRFVITVRDFKGDMDALQARLQRVREQGVANYFGPQRFGIEGGNIAQARAWLAGEAQPRHFEQGIWLSAARSYLFNDMLAARVAAGTWNVLLEGDCAQLSGSNSFFAVEQVDEVLRQRLLEGDIHPSCALWGEGELPSKGTLAELEQKVASANPELARLCEQQRLRQERRATRLLAADMNWTILSENTWQVSFFLPKGAFATSILAELIGWQED